MPVRPGLFQDPICTFERCGRAVDRVQTPIGIQASDAFHFKNALFGRDSLQVALDLVEWYPALAERIIFSLAPHWGIESNPLTEEEPGRGPHEHRQLVLGGQKVSPAVEEIFYKVGKADFGLDVSSGEWTYYGSIDCAPNMVRLVWQWCQLHGHDILDRPFVHRRRGEWTLRDLLYDAVSWIEQTIRRSPLGLLEFQRKNPNGLRWQVMRDGTTAYLHADGRLANANAPIAPLEVQGLAYDALLMAAELLPNEERSAVWERQAVAWRKLAAKLQRTTLRRFWMDEADCFAQAIDRDEAGAPRLLTVTSSAQAELLETRIFDNLSPARQKKFVGAIVRLMYSDEFLTEVGIRMRGASFEHLAHYYEYQGSRVSWVVTSNIFARGLRHQGLHALARDIENRYTDGLDTTGHFVEFWYVETDGTVAYFAQQHDPKASAWHISATNLPEDIQAWTVSAALRALYERQRVTAAPSSAPYAQQLEIDIDQRLREHYTAFVDTGKGMRMERGFVKRNQ